MSRYRLPPRVAPSPATEEPGQQNAASRLRSSREAQAKLLEERRGRGGAVPAPEPLSPKPAPVAAEQVVAPQPAPQAASDGTLSGKPKTPPKTPKRKLVVLFRLPVAAVADISLIAAASGLPPDYDMKALAKECRATLRQLNGAEDAHALAPSARQIRNLTADQMTTGEAMTVYLRLTVIEAMHDALGDPWRIEPRATVVGAFLTAIVIRRIAARRAEGGG